MRADTAPGLVATAIARYNSHEPLEKELDLLTPSPIIHVTHLSKRFDDILAVNDLSFSVAPGEMVGLLGPNGAGKTTVLQLLLGLTTPTAGEEREKEPVKSRDHN
jgi:ABC-type uncharacterized transport system ATPase subunit